MAQYRIRNPFAIEKMQVNQAGDSIIYRSAMNPKIQRNPSTSLGTLSLSKGFPVFTPCDFIAAITQHIPDKSKIPARRRRGRSGKPIHCSVRNAKKRCASFRSSTTAR